MSSGPCLDISFSKRWQHVKDWGEILIYIYIYIRVTKLLGLSMGFKPWGNDHLKTIRVNLGYHRINFLKRKFNVLTVS